MVRFSTTSPSSTIRLMDTTQICTFRLSWRQVSRLRHLANGTLIVYNHLLLYGFGQWKRKGLQPSPALLSEELGTMRATQRWLIDIPLSLLQKEVDEVSQRLALLILKRPHATFAPKIKKGRTRVLDIQPICRCFGKVLLIESLGTFVLRRTPNLPLRSTTLRWEGGPYMVLRVEESPCESKR